MSERKKRDAGIDTAMNNPNNNYDMIVSLARYWLHKQVLPGKLIVSGQVFKAVLENHPNLEPSDKRVMGAVMRQLEREKLLVPAGISTRMRSHMGFAREWKRTRSEASF